MKIISWNVNGLRAVVKKGNWSWLMIERPDIFCLQETKATAEQLPEEAWNGIVVVKQNGELLDASTSFENGFAAVEWLVDMRQIVA